MSKDESEKSLIGDFARITISGTTITAFCMVAPIACASSGQVEAIPHKPTKAKDSKAQGSILTGHMPVKTDDSKSVNVNSTTVKSKYAVLTGYNANIGNGSNKEEIGTKAPSKNQGSILTGYNPNKANSEKTVVASNAPVKAQGSKSKNSVSVSGNSNSGSAVNLGNMTVTGEKSPSVVTRHKQKKAKNIVSVRSAKQIRQLPDINAAEAISRQPGVTLQEDSGAGRYVHIRGLSADLSTVTFAGVQLPPTNPSSPAGGGRAVALDTFPSALIGSTSVTKTNMPDEDAGALGGTIEITPKSIPKSQNYIVQGHVGGGAKIQPGTPDYSLGLTVGKRFSLQSTKDKKYARKPFSVVGSVAYHNWKSYFPDREDSYANKKGLPHNAYQGFYLRRYHDHRKTLGFGGKVEYSPTKNSHYYVDYYNSGYNETLNKDVLDINNLAAGAHPVPGGIKSPNAQYKVHRVFYQNKVNTQLVKFGGRNHFKNFSVNYHGSYALGTYNSGHSHTGVFTQSKRAGIVYNNTKNPNIPTYRVVNGPQPTRLRGYKLTGYKPWGGFGNYRTKIWTGAVNFTLPTDLFAQSNQENFKFGLKTRLLTRKGSKNVPQYKSVGHMKLSSAYNNRTVTLYNHHYSVPGVSGKRVLQYYNSHPGQFPVNRRQTQLNAAKNFSLDHEHVYAGYFQYHVKFHKLGILAGMRFEGTQGTYHANKVTKRNGTHHISPNTNHTSYWNYFPTVQLRYAFTRRLIGRFVYSTAIARPGFTQLSASETLNPSGLGSIHRGNPSLKPTTDNAFDFSLAYYMPHGVVSVNPFDKELSNYIVATTKRVKLPNTPQYQGFSGNARIHSYKNLNSARVYGVEFNYRQRFAFLPGALSGLGANLNYTYTHSSGKIHPHHSGMLPETSKHTLNAGLFYKTHKIGLHAAMQYRSKDLFGVGPTPSQDVYSQPRLSVSLGAHYQFRKHFQFYAQAKNLTNTPLELTKGKNSNHQIQREYYGPTITGGIRINFGGGGSYARNGDQANHD